MSNNIHLGDIGTIFKVRILDDSTSSPIDISSSIEKVIKFKKSNGVILERNAVFTTDGSDGYMEYSTIAGDLNVSGNWTIQGFVKSSTFENNSEIGVFEIKPNI